MDWWKDVWESDNEHTTEHNTLRACLAMILAEVFLLEVFPFAVFMWKTLLWESEKMILIVFLILCCISIKTLLVLINYQKRHTISITKRK